MKIYVSEKDTIEKGGEYYLKTDTAIYINSLEQHDTEIRKPLEDEIERLKQVTADDIYKELEQIKQEEINRCVKENINTFIKPAVKQAKQEVIHHLLEWLEENCNEYVYHEYGNVYICCIAQDSLEQKLNEMKGCSDE